MCRHLGPEHIEEKIHVWYGRSEMMTTVGHGPAASEHGFHEG